MRWALICLAISALGCEAPERQPAEVRRSQTPEPAWSATPIHWESWRHVIGQGVGRATAEGNLADARQRVRVSLRQLPDRIVRFAQELAQREGLAFDAHDREVVERAARLAVDGLQEQLEEVDTYWEERVSAEGTEVIGRVLWEATPDEAGPLLEKAFERAEGELGFVLERRVVEATLAEWARRTE